mmetsp:Transcript_12859/g.16286  ORF Transcript_12859/g.16286 Transcript_12859/m.16286 type:complete len:113 (-) Transcript_12859:535-873(-)
MIIALVASATNTAQRHIVRYRPSVRKHPQQLQHAPGKQHAHAARCQTVKSTRECTKEPKVQRTTVSDETSNIEMPSPLSLSLAAVLASSPSPFPSELPLILISNKISFSTPR